MNLVVKGRLLHYRALGQPTAPVMLLLHGWGSSSQAFDQLAGQLSSDFRVVLLDLPGFGNSDLPPSTWHITDYAGLVKSFVAKAGLEPIDCLGGHSFGGRVAIKAVGTGILKPGHLVLFGSAGIGHSRSLRNQLFKAAAKTGKVVTSLPGLSAVRSRLRSRLYQAAGSTDYVTAGPLRQVFVNTINEDLQSAAAHIKVPTLLIWGDHDSETPISDGQKLAAKIRGSKFKIVDSAGHYVFADQPQAVEHLLREFLK